MHRFVPVRERGLVGGSGKRPDDHHHYHGRRRHPQIEVCMHATSDCSDTPQQCSTFTEENIKETCGPGDSVLGGDSVTGASNVACEDDTLKVELYSNSQCNSDASSECTILHAFAGDGMQDCHIAFELNKCINLMGMGMHRP